MGLFLKRKKSLQCLNLFAYVCFAKKKGMGDLKEERSGEKDKPREKRN